MSNFKPELGKPRLRSLDGWLVEKLKDPELAKAYLAEHFTDDGEADFEQLQLVALKKVAESKGYKLVPLHE